MDALGDDFDLGNEGDFVEKEHQSPESSHHHHHHHHHHHMLLLGGDVSDRQHDHPFGVDDNLLLGPGGEVLPFANRKRGVVDPELLDCKFEDLPKSVIVVKKAAAGGNNNNNTNDNNNDDNEGEAPPQLKPVSLQAGLRSLRTLHKTTRKVAGAGGGAVGGVVGGVVGGGGALKVIKAGADKVPEEPKAKVKKLPLEALPAPAAAAVADDDGAQNGGENDEDEDLPFANRLAKSNNGEDGGDDDDSDVNKKKREEEDKVKQKKEEGLFVPPPKQHKWSVRRHVSWTAADTDRFYNCIRQFGTDFTSIVQFFPNLERGDIVAKYKAESSHNAEKLNKAMSADQRLEVNEQAFEAAAHEYARQRTLKPSGKLNQAQKDLLAFAGSENDVRKEFGDQAAAAAAAGNRRKRDNDDEKPAHRPGVHAYQMKGDNIMVDLETGEEHDLEDPEDIPLQAMFDDPDENLPFAFLHQAPAKQQPQRAAAASATARKPAAKKGQASSASAVNGKSAASAPSVTAAAAPKPKRAVATNVVTDAGADLLASIDEDDDDLPFAARLSKDSGKRGRGRPAGKKPKGPQPGGGNQLLLGGAGAVNNLAVAEVDDDDFMLDPKKSASFYEDGDAIEEVLGEF